MQLSHSLRPTPVPGTPENAAMRPNAECPRARSRMPPNSISGLPHRQAAACQIATELTIRAKRKLKAIVYLIAGDEVDDGFEFSFRSYCKLCCDLAGCCLAVGETGDGIRRHSRPGSWAFGVWTHRSVLGRSRNWRWPKRMAQLHSSVARALRPRQPLKPKPSRPPCAKAPSTPRLNRACSHKSARAGWPALDARIAVVMTFVSGARPTANPAVGAGAAARQSRQ